MISTQHVASIVAAVVITMLEWIRWSWDYSRRSSAVVKWFRWTCCWDHLKRATDPFLLNGTGSIIWGDPQLSSSGSTVGGAIWGDPQLSSSGTTCCCWDNLKRSTAVVKWFRCWWDNLKRSTAVVKWFRLLLLGKFEEIHGCRQVVPLLVGQFEEIHGCRQMVPLVVVVGTIWGDPQLSSNGSARRWWDDLRRSTGVVKWFRLLFRCTCCCHSLFAFFDSYLNWSRCFNSREMCRLGVLLVLVHLGGSLGELHVLYLTPCGGPQNKIKGSDVLVRLRK